MRFQLANIGLTTSLVQHHQEFAAVVTGIADRNRTGVVRPSPRKNDARRDGAELLREEISERAAVVHRTHGGT
jgi:hypothetical protein